MYPLLSTVTPRSVSALVTFPLPSVLVALPTPSMRRDQPNLSNHRADRRGHNRVPSVTAIPDQGPVAGRRRAETPAARRRAARHTAPRGPLFRGLPSAPILLGIAALAVSAGGAITAGDPALVSENPANRISAASAVNGQGETSSTSLLNDRRAAVSRDSRREALEQTADAELVEAAEALGEERNAALALFAKQAEAQAAKLRLNQWVLPVDNVQITAEFGDYGLWASYHTGLDFNGNTGDPIRSIANGVVTSAGYDGSYGNKTVVTLEDGTEIWYCHQNTFGVSVGDVVSAGEVIGTIGATGHVTGSHLHLEVRPGGGDPVDPYAAFVVHGVTP